MIDVGRDIRVEIQIIRRMVVLLIEVWKFGKDKLVCVGNIDIYLKKFDFRVLGFLIRYI